MMWHHAVVRELLVGRNQQALFPLRHFPQGVILHPFIWGATNSTDVMVQHAQCPDSHEGNMLIHEDLHTSPDKTSSGVTCSSASEAA